MKRFLIALALIVSAMCLLVGCSKEIASSSSSTKNVTYEGTTYTIPQNPTRIACLSNSLLYMIYELDGTAICRTESLDKLPANMEKLPVIGHTSHINMEDLLALKPDLVLGLKNQHDKYGDILTTNKVLHMLISYDGINDNVPLLEALGKVLNKEDKANEAIARYNAKIAKVKDAIKDKKPLSVAILFASGKSITAETNKSIAASMIQELGMNDVVAKHITSSMENSKTIPYSLETLSVDNPEVIFVVTMGKRSQINEQMKLTMTDNPAWNNLQAVKNNRVYYLPSHLFLINPGLKTPDAMAELAKDLYGVTVDLSK